jgi:hypothetical protein
MQTALYSTDPCPGPGGSTILGSTDGNRKGSSGIHSTTGIKTQQQRKNGRKGEKNALSYLDQAVHGVLVVLLRSDQLTIVAFPFFFLAHSHLLSPSYHDDPSWRCLDSMEDMQIARRTRKNGTIRLITKRQDTSYNGIRSTLRLQYAEKR